MRIIQPPWVSHGEKDRQEKGLVYQISAIDIHPDGTKVATAGESENGGRICIWSMEPIIKKKAELNPNTSQLLKMIDGHQQVVHALRWSNAGDCFASAGGDHLAMIWSANDDNKYKAIATLRGHSLDVLDVSWSPNDEYLATASMDNLIIIWNTRQWTEIVKTIRKHENYVKGVSWDPIGKYLASQSTDKTLRIWRVSDWGEEACISEPFQNTNTSSFVTRIDWSPDGQFVVSAQAMNGEGFVSKIIERTNWTYEKDFVGHRKNICCVAFSPHIFKRITPSKSGKKESKFKPQCVLALGSRDRSISVWATSNKRPIVVVNDVFENTVLDLSWSPCGYKLMACSLDGSVVLFEFSKEDLGEVYDMDEKQSYLQQFYGKSFGTKKVRDMMIEDVGLLLAQNEIDMDGDKDSGDKDRDKNGDKDKAKINGTVVEKKVNGVENGELKKDKDKDGDESGDKDRDKKSDDPKDAKDKDKDKKSSDCQATEGKQVEIRQADGKKRIMTLLKPKNNNITVNTCSTSSESKSKIVIETYDEKNIPKEVQEKFLSQTSNGKGQSSEDSEDSRDSLKKNTKKKVDRKAGDESSDGDEPVLLKKRKKKIDLNEEDDDEDDGYYYERDQIRDKMKDRRRKMFASGSKENSKDDDSQNLAGLNEESQQSLMRYPYKKHRSKHITVGKIRQPVQIFASERLPRQTIPNMKLFGTADRFTHATIEYPSVTSALVKLTIAEDAHPLWCTVLSSPIIFISANEQIVVVVSEDLTLTTFNTRSGGRLNSSFVVENDISKIMFGDSKSHICVLTCEGRLWIWDVVSPRIVVKGINLIPILVDPKSGDKFAISKVNFERDNVVISVSNGKTYQYEKALEAWCLLRNNHDPLAVSVNFKGLRVDGLRKEIFQTPSHKLVNLFTANTSFGQLSLISFIEQQISRTKLIKNYEEFVFWTKIFVQNLVQMHSSGFNADNIEVRLRDLCSSLLGSRFPNALLIDFDAGKSSSISTDKKDVKISADKDSEDFMGSESAKHQLLRELLKIISSQTSLQRLYLEFREQLDAFKDQDQPMDL